MPANYFTPSDVRLLPEPVRNCIADVDDLNRRIDEAQQRANKFGPLAENADRHYNDLVRATVQAGGAAAEVVDERNTWRTEHEAARADLNALRPMRDAAWRTLRESLLEHAETINNSVEPVITAAAEKYAHALELAAQAEVEHRAALTLRKWTATATRAAGPDPYRPDRQQPIGDTGLTAADALELLHRDADALEAMKTSEAKAKARRDREQRIRDERAAAAAQRAQQEVEQARRLAEQRAAHREKELAATAAAEAKQIPGMPVVP